jgi:cyclophilin family peptidyl-prolyl cis-trans isomerase
MKAYLTLHHGPKELGTLHLELYDDVVPRTVHNFATLLERSQPHGLLRSTFHRIIPGFMAQGGDFTSGDGTGGFSVYGPEFEDENFVRRHDRAGILSMANSGPDTNGSQFFVTFRPAPDLDGEHVVFGHVDLAKSADVLEALERTVATGRNDRPLKPVTIVNGGIVVRLSDDEEEKQPPAREVREEILHDEAEIDLDEDGTDDQARRQNPEDDNNEDNDESEPSAPPKSKGDALKNRLRNLKQKMNQARQLNQRAVQEEGERLSRQDAERRRVRGLDKQRDREAWEARHAKALEVADRHGVDAKHLTQQAHDSLRRAHVRSEKAEATRHSSRDYHNPEGQALNYQRNLRSLPKRNGPGDSAAGAASGSTTATTTATYNPLDHPPPSADSAERERQGARRLADELHRRIDKQKAAQLDKHVRDDTDGDAGHINKRNRLFNEKIKRNYDGHTAEIRQNLERGTAL